MTPGPYQRVVLRPLNGTNFADIAKNGLIRSIGPTGISTPGAYARVATDVAQVANTALASANAILGVANLAVGVFTAYQSYQTRKDVGLLRSELSAEMACVRSLLLEESRKLDAIFSQAEKHDAKLDLLLARIEAGFTETILEVGRTVSTIRTDDLRQRMMALDRSKSALAHALEEPAPDEHDILEAERSAANLADFCRAQLAASEMPLEARQTLFLVRVDAEILLQDCRLFRRGASGMKRAKDETASLRAQIIDEARHINSDPAPWQVAKFIAAHTARYQVLSAALEQRADYLAGIHSEREVEFVEPARLLPDSNSGNVAPTLTLSTLSDYDWYVRASGADRDSFQVRSIESIDRSTLESSVGAPSGQLSIDALRILADPATWLSYEELATETCGAPVKVKAGLVPQPGPPRVAAASPPTPIPAGNYAFTYLGRRVSVSLDDGTVILRWNNNHTITLKRFSTKTGPEGQLVENYGNQHSYADAIATAATFSQTMSSANGFKIRLVGKNSARLDFGSEIEWLLLERE